ncbi:MAG: T9SS type A sorting domain-containing protein [Bacteroidota bacterium]|nr:T9SS type A sorting domain-containing protein [Bacteroidota bacterium]
MELKCYFSKNYTKLLLVFFITVFLNTQAESATVTITVANFQFTPNNTSVTVGDSIKYQWLNGFHTTTCDGVFPGTSLPAGAATWDTPMDDLHPVFIYVVTVPGTYNYVCIPHAPGMAGQFVASSGNMLVENFDYPVGDSLGSHGWVSFSGGTTNVLSVTSPGLVYSGYIFSNIGNASRVIASGQDAYKRFNNNDSLSAGTMYTSFMVNVTSAQAGDYFFAFLPPPPTSNSFYTARFYAKDSAGGFAFGLSKSSATGGPIVYTGGNYSYGTTYLVVIKYQFITGPSNDIMDAFIFSSGVPSVEPATPTIGPVTGTVADNNLGKIALRQGSTAIASVANVDGFNVSTSWDFATTSISNISNSISENFYLAQNYPNPFNPSTTIKYNISESGFVNLSVYNSLGKEVRNLINSNVNAGSYSIDFNGSELNSGVYFYKLTYINEDGNNFVDTKKFILLK